MAVAYINTAVVPVPRLELDAYDWYERHNLKVQAAAARNHDLVFIGDSITHLWEGTPGRPGCRGQVWNDCYGRRHAFNLGFGWDRTQNVLWRLSHGEFAGQTPRAVVLLIGTNNLTATEHARSNTPEEIVAGTQAICEQILAASPRTHILLMGIFPRGEPDDPLRLLINSVNRHLKAAMASREAVMFMDIGTRFLSRNGTIPIEFMEDGVHPTEAGYRIWADAIEPAVARWLA